MLGQATRAQTCPQPPLCGKPPTQWADTFSTSLLLTEDQKPICCPHSGDTVATQRKTLLTYLCVPSRTATVRALAH